MIGSTWRKTALLVGCLVATPLTHAEVAEALELPLGTVKSDLVRGHELLRARLGHARGGTQ